MTTLTRLQQWYAKQCNGSWEHSLGVLIETCDNPGWWVKVNLKGTDLQDVGYLEIAENVNAAHFAQGPEWLNCRIEDGTWHGAGDQTKLERILELFLDWAEAHRT